MCSSGRTAGWQDGGMAGWRGIVVVTHDPAPTTRSLAQALALALVPREDRVLVEAEVVLHRG